MSGEGPAVTWFDAETCRIVWERPDPIQIDFARISETARADATVAVMTITTDIAELGRVAGPVRINLYSASAIDGLRRACQNVTSVPDWQRILGDSIAAVLESFGVPVGTVVDPHAEWAPPSWLLPPLLESEGYTVLYARGGSGKSFLAAAACLSVASGQPILGMEPSTVGPVVYLDWESSADTFGYRISQLASGNEIGTIGNRIHHYRMAGPFAARRAGMAPVLARIRPALVVIDSKGLATTGAPESSEGILDLARALDYLDMPVLLIDHVSKGAIKGDDPDMAFGSQYVEAAARLAWSLRSEPRPGSIILRLANTKANNHARRKDPLILELMFSGQGATILTDTAGRPTTGPADNLTANATRILDYLATHGPSRMIDIARETGVNKGTVYRTLTNTEGFTRTPDDTWTVFTPPDHTPF